MEGIKGDAGYETNKCYAGWGGSRSSVFFECVSGVIANRACECFKNSKLLIIIYPIMLTNVRPKLIDNSVLEAPTPFVVFGLSRGVSSVFSVFLGE